MAIVKPVILEDGQLKTAGVGDQVPQSYVEGLDSSLGAKVDKVAGKGLSDENYTQEEKTKLDGIASEATKNRADSANADKVHEHTTEQVTGLDSALAEKVSNTDPRLTDSREWSEETVTQTEAEAGTASTRRAWTAQRVWQAINAWWQLVTSGFGRNLIAATNEQAARNVLQLTYPATAPTVGDGVAVLRDGAFGVGGYAYTQDFKSKGGQNQFFAGYLDPEFPDIHAGVTLGYSSDWWTQLIARPNGTPELSVRSFYGGSIYSPICTLYHTGNLLNIGTTAASAHAALGLGYAATAPTAGEGNAVMMTGAFGLGGKMILGSNTDPNPTGFYYNPTNAQAHNSGEFFLDVKYSEGNYAAFRLSTTVYSNDIYWQRGLGGGVYGLGDPVKLLHTGNILATTGQSNCYPMTQKAVTDAINGVSDRRDKVDITPSGVGLDLIEKLEPVSFRLNKRDWYRKQAATSFETHSGEEGAQTEVEKINPDVIAKPLTDYDDNDGSLARDDKYTGLIAQDVKASLEDLGLGDLAIIKNYSDEYEGGDDRHYIEYNGLIPVMINAIKELSTRVKELEIKVDDPS